MARTIRRAATQQPTGRVRVNNGSQYTPGAFIYPIGAGAPAMGMASQRMPVVVGARKVGSVGPYVSLSAAASDMIRLGVDSRMQVQTFCVLMVVRVDAVPAGGNVFTLFESGSAANGVNGNSNGSFQFRVGSAGGLSCIKDNVVEIISGADGQFAFGKWQALSLSFMAGSTGRGRTTIAIDGRLSMDIPTNVSDLTSGQFTIGTKDGTANEKGPINVALFAYWPNAQTAVDMVALTANPWQLFEGNTTPLYAAAPAAPVALASADTLGPVDACYANLLTAAQVSDILAAADARSAALNAQAGVTDTLAATDAGAVSLNGQMVAADTLAALDTDAATLSGQANVGEAAALSDTQSAIARISADLADMAAAADQVSTGAAVGISLASDSVVTTDVAGAALSASTGRSDSLSALDTSQAQVQYICSLLDGLGVVDQSYIAGITYTAGGQDVVAVTDSYASSKRSSASGADALAALEQAAALLVGGPGGTIDIDRVPKSRWIVYEGGTRVITYEGGTRVVVYEGTTKTVRY